jgi:murein DD-endopeptidase MepM/ murein hydrolase activator NlpD
MKFFIFVFLLFFIADIYGQESILPAQKDRKLKDDSSYIYSLPYPHGKCYLLVQAYDSWLSHRDEKALDFKMRTGTKFSAARDGIVIEVIENFDRGGIGNRFLPRGNHIGILHDDGTIGFYWHLKKDGSLVNVFDSVKKGQVIGLSGNTGFSLFPHLHFEVRRYNAKGNFEQLPTRFLTRKGVMYLRPLRFYKNANGR